MEIETTGIATTTAGRHLDVADRDIETATEKAIALQTMTAAAEAAATAAITIITTPKKAEKS
jgi:hypothetical protein